MEKGPLEKAFDDIRRLNGFDFLALAKLTQKKKRKAKKNKLRKKFKKR